MRNPLNLLNSTMIDSERSIGGKKERKKRKKVKFDNTANEQEAPDAINL